MKKKVSVRAASATALALLLGALVVAPASAHGSTTWITWCDAYSGNSWYNTGTGIAYSVTGSDGGDEVGAAVRYYQGSTAYTTGFGYAQRTRALASYGGYHQSYCPIGTQTRST